MSSFRWTEDHAKAFSEYHIITKGRSTTAAEKYCRIARMFFTWATAEGMPLTRDTVEHWMRHLAIRCDNRSNATRASRLSSLRSVCKWLVEIGHLEANPCEGVPTPKFSKAAAQKFSPAELTALFADPGDNKAISLRDRCILMLFYATGMRRNEVATLTLDRITLATRTGRVHVIGKGAKHRTISFEGPLVHLLKTWLVVRAQFAHSDEKHLFIALHGFNAGRAIGNGGLHKTIKRAGSRMGLPDNTVFLHKLRSTYATDLYDSGGIEVKNISMLMGHASTDTTWGYIAISERHLQRNRIKTNKWEQLGVAG